MPAPQKGREGEREKREERRGKKRHVHRMKKGEQHRGHFASYSTLFWVG